VCAEPRGVALSGDDVLVACASGELVQLTSDLGIVKSHFVAPDLRDVVVEGDQVGLSTFRDARVLRAEQTRTGGALFAGGPRYTACHDGAQLSDAALHVVREGDEATKTPSLLGLGSRGPWMHDGCAPTLRDRITDEACGGGDLHGQTSHLSGDAITALEAYLKTL